MHDHLKRRIWLAGWMMLLLTAAGCFQPLGGELEPTSQSEALPTFTPFPPTATPIPPTDTPAPLDLFPTATLQIFEIGTPVAEVPLDQSQQIPAEQLDPLSLTVTASYLESIGVSPLDVVPFDATPLDPLLQEATALVGTATAQVAIPMTQTWEAMFGVTATSPIIIGATATPIGPIISGQDCIYEVQPTDSNLYRISLLFGLPYMDIARASNLVNPNLIHVGDRLVIPGCGTTGFIPPPTTVPSVVPPTQIPGGPGSGQTYTVVAGDTLYHLSIRWGTTITAIATLNQIPNPNLIFIGQVLTIP